MGMGISWISLNVTSYLPLQSTVVKMEDDMDYSDTQSPMAESMQDDTSSTQENTVDSTVHTLHQGEEEIMYSWKINWIKL